MKAVYQKKLRRLRKTRQPTLIDLFAGCGGLSLGFKTAGFDLVAGVELDPAAARSHARNLLGATHPNSPHRQPADVHEEPANLMGRLGLNGTPLDEAVDVLIGGPPCQAYSRVGRAKLRAEARRTSTRKDERAWLSDPRANLYRRYLHYVDELKPLAIVMENVPDAMNHGGRDMAGLVAQELEARGYRARYTLLNAANFGVPQTRERLFLIAWHESTGLALPSFPKPTHTCKMPSGYLGTRACALKTVLRDESGQPLFYVDPPENGAVKKRVPGTRSALKDLPSILAMKLMDQGILKRGVRRLDQPHRYPTPNRRTPFARLMRQWPGFATNGTVTAHEIRFLPRDYKLFAQLAPGDDYPKARAKAEQMLDQHLQSLARRPRPGSSKFDDLLREYVPPYDPAKFPNKWGKLDPKKPARTLMAHLGKDGYSHIHYCNEQARTISVREAARLQSFPDGFEFDCAMNAGFRQIGNAVPPLLSYAVAREIWKGLGLRLRPDIRKRVGLI